MSVTGQRLRELREETGKSQGDVAKLIGVSRPAYVSYETGRSNPSRKLNELASIFFTSVDYLLGRSDNRHPILGVEGDGSSLDKSRSSIANLQTVKNTPQRTLLVNATKGLSEEEIAILVGMADSYRESIRKAKGELHE